MVIQATDEQVKTMVKLAVLASRPVGMGFLSHNPNLTADQITFDEPIERGLYIDYFMGRMVKFNGRKTPEGWSFSDDINGEYQSWIYTYPSYQALYEAAVKVGAVDPVAETVTD